MTKILLLLPIALLIFTPIAEAQRGCCSRHKGVSAKCTKYGRVVCKDRSTSPTCRCKPRQ